MQFSSIWPIDRTLSGATTPGHSRPGINGNEGVLHIPQSSSIIGTLPSDCLCITWTLVGGWYYPSAKMQSMYSAAPADRARWEYRSDKIADII